MVRTKPVVVGGSLSDPEHVSCTSAKSCLATGDSFAPGGIYAESWNGAKWTRFKVAVPANAASTYLADISCTGSVLVGVACRSATACTAVGSRGPLGAQASSALSGFWSPGRPWRLVTA
jgi:hypothetical protein